MILGMNQKEYKTIEKICSCCGHEQEDIVAYDVGKGVIAGIKVNVGNVGIEEESDGVIYKISIKDRIRDLPNVYTNRIESAVYATEKEAEVALRAEEE